MDRLHFVIITSKKKDIASARHTLQPWVDSGYIRLTIATTLNEQFAALTSRERIDCIVCDMSQEEEFYEGGIQNVMSVTPAELKVSACVTAGVTFALCHTLRSSTLRFILLTDIDCNNNSEYHLVEHILRHELSRTQTDRFSLISSASAEFEGYWDEETTQLVFCAGHEEILPSKTAVDWRKVIQQSHLFPYLSEAALAAAETTH